MTFPSHEYRNNLRQAIRRHKDAEDLLAGRYISNLKLAELEDIAKALGISVSNNPVVPAVAAVDQDNTTKDQDAMPKVVEQDAAPDFDAVESEVRRLKDVVVNSGLNALDEHLRKLIGEANKPPVVVEIEVPVAAPAGGPVAVGVKPVVPVVVSKPVPGKTETWKKLFNVSGALGSNVEQIWDGLHPLCPKSNPLMLWPPGTAIALSQLARGRNAFFYGPPGNGKTLWAKEYAARTGRPYMLIACDNGTDAGTLVGLTVPDNGGVVFQDGALVKAIRIPGCVVAIDEASTARAGALMVMQNLLENRELFIAETGERVVCAPGVLFVAGDNTNGTGGGAKRGFVDTNRLNAAFMTRWHVKIHVGYMAPAKEARLLVDYTGCPLELAKLLVSAASVTRAEADKQVLSAGIGFRALKSWAELLLDGIPAKPAFEATVLNAAPEGEVETLRQQCLLAYDADLIAKALGNESVVEMPDQDQDVDEDGNDPANTNPSEAGRVAAAQFRY